MRVTRKVRFGLVVFGVLVVAMGLLWIGQGTGVVPWPEVSPMINVSVWAWRGLILVAIGGVLIWIGRRRSA